MALLQRRLWFLVLIFSGILVTHSSPAPRGLSLTSLRWDTLTEAFSSIGAQTSSAFYPCSPPPYYIGSPSGEPQAKKRTTATGRLCVPPESRRAYVTSLTTSLDELWGVRVLAESLRHNGGKVDIVVLIHPSFAVDRRVRSLLLREEIVMFTLPESLADHSNRALATIISCWGLTKYDRIIYFDPTTLVLRNPDALFACEGLCFRNDPTLITSRERSSQKAQTRVSSFSTGVLVLEPSSTHFRHLLTQLPASSSKTPADSFLSQSLSLNSCRFFGTDISAHDDSQRYIKKSEFGEPFVLLSNPTALPQCGPNDFVTQENVTCGFIPYSYNAPARDLQANSKWSSTHSQTSSPTDQMDPHVIRFSTKDGPWNSLSYLSNPFFWRWDAYRSTLSNPYGELADVWLVWVMLLFPPLVLACSIFKPKPSSDVQTLPSADCPEGDLPPLTTPRSPTSFLVCSSLWVLMYLWFSASLSFSQYLVRRHWHPMAAVGVYEAWLSLALVFGYLTIEYLLVVRSKPKHTIHLLFSLLMGVVVMVTLFAITDAASVAFVVGALAAVLTHSLMSGLKPFTTLLYPKTFSNIVQLCLTAAFLTGWICSWSGVTSDMKTKSLMVCTTGHQLLFASFASSVACSLDVRKTLSRWLSDLSARVGCFRAPRPRNEPYWTLSKALWFAFGASLLLILVLLSHHTLTTKLPFQLPTQCLHTRKGFLSWRDSKLGVTCSRTETFRLKYTDVYQEAYKQFKVCLAVPTKGSTQQVSQDQFLTLERNVSPLCEPENQLVLQPVEGSRTQYCLYSPVRGLYVSSGRKPSPLCKQNERWEVNGNFRMSDLYYWGRSTLPSFFTAYFLSLHPSFALFVYACFALWESSRPSSPVRAFISYTWWFLFSLHLLYFVSHANQHFVYGPSAFATASNENWFVADGVARSVGIQRINEGIRLIFKKHLGEVTQALFISTLSMSNFAMVFVCLTHAFVSSVKDQPVASLEMTKTQFYQLKLTIFLLHVLSTFSCIVKPVGRPLIQDVCEALPEIGGFARSFLKLDGLCGSESTQLLDPVMVAPYAFFITKLYSQSSKWQIRSLVRVWLVFVLVTSVGIGLDCAFTLAASLITNYVAWCAARSKVVTRIFCRTCWQSTADSPMKDDAAQSPPMRERKASDDFGDLSPPTFQPSFSKNAQSTSIPQSLSSLRRVNSSTFERFVDSVPGSPRRSEYTRSISASVRPTENLTCSTIEID